MSDVRSWLLFVGPPKTGTSWIDHVLRSSEDVRLPQGVKETFFFDRHFDRGFSWYLAQFAARRSDRLFVEVGPTYFFAKHALQRIESTLPDARIFITLRDPVRRSVSHYLHTRRRGLTDLSIGKAIEQFPSIVTNSIYAQRLDRWYSHFGRNNVEVIFYEDVIGNLPRFTKTLAGYEIGELSLKEPDKRVNAASAPRFRFVARSTELVVRKLRSVGLHRVVEAGKGVGLRDAVFSGGALPDARDMENELSAWKSDFMNDRAALARLIGRDPPWTV
ncbi:sulfotransferase [Methyloceanibacter sp.]|uniref:sulfotransferase family protein n=1 Tax=Methyloceanibacter sp. TaxID=1965321 RepID=UPI002CBC9E53|nr:sulfotransferase [Methyloceanibacter sp.]HML91933.1 sulfotransferase [Methyloceanibacter sp.]